jgi:predicted PolB exonuclease-like 3'-5' exonuclease
MTPVLAFDIETVPDIGGLRRIHGLPPDMSDAQVAELAFQRRREATGSDFLPLHVHRVVAISCALRERNSFTVWSLGDPQDPEGELLQRFFDGVEKYTPQLVSWNGGGFDLPVLHYRALVHRVRAQRYWDLGEDDREFKWNNYISRYHMRHLDLMDLLSLYQPRAAAPLHDMARLLGFPGKLGMDGSEVWAAFQRGELAAIRSYCETDAANTYLVFLRFQLLRGVLSEGQYESEIGLAYEALAHYPANHWQEFVRAWQRDSSSESGGGHAVR